MEEQCMEGCTHLVQGRAVGRSEGLGWGWATPDDMKIGKKEAAMWAGRQAEVKEVRSDGAYQWSYLAECMLFSVEMRCPAGVSI